MHLGSADVQQEDGSPDKPQLHSDPLSKALFASEREGPTWPFSLLGGRLPAFSPCRRPITSNGCLNRVTKPARLHASAKRERHAPTGAVAANRYTRGGKEPRTPTDKARFSCVSARLLSRRSEATRGSRDLSICRRLTSQALIVKTVVSGALRKVNFAERSTGSRRPTSPRRLNSATTPRFDPRS